jgi:hypothetical protein
MSRFSEVQTELFKDKASKEKFFAKFVHYNSYLQITYVIPQSEFKGFKVPQWSMVTSVVAFENSFILTLALFNDVNWLYDIDVALKHDLITFKLD